jgi:hypothetical protein
MGRFIYEITDAKGQVIRHEYDALKRMTKQTRFTSPGVEETAGVTEFFYDSNPVDAGYSQNDDRRLAAVKFYIRNALGSRIRIGPFRSSNLAPPVIQQ